VIESQSAGTKLKLQNITLAHAMPRSAVRTMVHFLQPSSNATHLKPRFREIERISPYEGATQRTISRTSDDACNANPCLSSDTIRRQ
jgi:hypothetical protein